LLDKEEIMTDFKRKGWLKIALEKSRKLLSLRRPHSLIGNSENQPKTAESSTMDEIAATVATTDTTESSYIHIAEYAKPRKWSIIQGCAVLGLAAVISIAGHQYVSKNMAYQVFVNGKEVGAVKDPQTIEQIKADKKKEVEQISGNVDMELKEPLITYSPEKVFVTESDEQSVLQKVSSSFIVHPVGVELKVDGKVIGILKDKATAEEVLQQIKDKAVAKKKNTGKVGILSASQPPAVSAGETELQSVEFVQKVELNQIDIQPQDIDDPQEILKKLETGDVQPMKYTVEKGDCVSCIAKKFGISKQVIYQNNPWITDDMIKVGEQLDLTVLQPTLAVKTVEKVVENEEIQYETEYKTDDNLREGMIQTISPGKNGLKKVTIQVTKVNGLMVEESVLDEEVIEQPVKAVVKKGTKVVKGEGSGKFAWPVVSATITSTFGNRWGAFHKGVDLTSGNKNILASDNGKVIFAGVKEGYGNCIIIDHMNGYKTLYGHLSKFYTTTGKIVEKGEKIGYMGSTGDSTGVHLHFEIQKNGVPENPLKYISR
jgi:murein DD-endopeptidase MepM/ murein hydrolase activator NlpD